MAVNMLTYGTRARGNVVIEALFYKTEGHGFESQSGH
jgi:hypothetical protein